MREKVRTKRLELASKLSLLEKKMFDIHSWASGIFRIDETESNVVRNVDNVSPHGFDGGASFGRVRGDRRANSCPVSIPNLMLLTAKDTYMEETAEGAQEIVYEEEAKSIYLSLIAAKKVKTDVNPGEILL